jgi:hypothetical protein
VDGGWGSSTRHEEAISLLRGLRGGTIPGSLVALLLCTCRRWDRVTAKLIAAVEECGVLSGLDLDELAESLLSDEVVAVFPLAWISGQWLELGTTHGTTRTVQVSDEAVARGREDLFGQQLEDTLNPDSRTSPCRGLLTGLFERLFMSYYVGRVGLEPTTGGL